jgi:hypothetical protein
MPIEGRLSFRRVNWFQGMAVEALAPKMKRQFPYKCVSWIGNELSATLPLLFPDRRRKQTVAVGTTIADRPPHRSVQARLRTRLLPRMSGGEAGVGIGVQNAGLGNPPIQDGEVTSPAYLAALTATN